MVKPLYGAARVAAWLVALPFIGAVFVCAFLARVFYRIACAIEDFAAHGAVSRGGEP